MCVIARVQNVNEFPAHHTRSTDVIDTWMHAASRICEWLELPSAVRLMIIAWLRSVEHGTLEWIALGERHGTSRYWVVQKLIPDKLIYSQRFIGEENTDEARYGPVF